MRLKKLLLAGVVAGAVGAGYTAGPAFQTGTSVTAFVGVHVIPMDRDTVVRDQTVLVRDGRVAEFGATGRVSVPADAVRIDGGGKFLMPALAEMHAHIPGGPPDQTPSDAAIERTLFLYAANGVGTIRGMLGHPRHLVYRDRAAAGELISPRIYTSGPSLNGNSVPTVDAAVESVVAQKKAGYDLLKIHPGIARPVFDALAAKAHEVGIPFAGHVPLDVGLQRALEARYRCIDHLDGYVEALAKDPAKSQFFGLNLIGEVDGSKIPALVAATKAAGTWQVPTQVLFDNMVSDEDPHVMSKRPELAYAMPQGVVTKWVAQKQQMLNTPADERQAFLALRRKLIKALHDGGVPFALGSDAPQVWNVPGFSVHRELESLVAAGLTPYQALRTGTVNVGVYFGTEDSTGTIARGRRADLLLLDGNPIEDIRNSAKVAGVMLNGRWIGKAEIAKRLESGS